MGRKKCEKGKNLLDTGPIPGQFLGNHGSNHYGVNTGVQRIERASVYKVVWQAARATCAAVGTFDENLPFLDAFHD